MGERIFSSVEGWNDIVETYIVGRDKLWCPKRPKVEPWWRDDDEGCYYVWMAYHAAKHAEVKDHKWYARILYMMAVEVGRGLSEYDRLRLYADPCVSEYGLALSDGAVGISEKELELARHIQRKLQLPREISRYVDKHWDEAIALIEGYEGLPDHFTFHDCKPVYFEHDEHSARLSLEDSGVIYDFLFEGVTGVNVSCVELGHTWIFDYALYPVGLFGSGEGIVLDLDHYSIACNRIYFEGSRRK